MCQQQHQEQLEMAPKKAAAKGPAAPEVVTPAQRPLVFLEIVEAAAWERYEQDKAAAEAAAAADAAAGIADDAGAEAAAESGAAANAPAAPPAYRLVFELLSDVVPRTAENFRQFACNTATVGDKKATRVVGYKGTKLLRWTQDFVQMGDVSGRDDGKGQESIHGHPTFDDEPFGAVPHKFGTLTMCNSGPNSNGSQFAIIAAPEPLPHLDGRHVAFGALWGKNAAEMEEQETILAALHAAVGATVTDPVGRVHAAAEGWRIRDCGPVERAVSPPPPPAA